MTKGVSLVLSGGGVRGLAHIGVLKVLEEEGIPIRHIVGSSAGSLIGAMYASCLDAQKLSSFAVGIPLYKLPAISFSGQGIIDGGRLTKAVEDFTGARRFEDLRIPLVVNATDLRTGNEVVFSNGDLLMAIHASCAFPGVIKPLEHDGMLLADGGVTNTLPIHLAPSRMPVVLSDVTGFAPLPKRPGLFTVTRQSLHILIKNVVDDELRRTSKRFVRVRPDVHEWEVFSFHKSKELIDRGERAMRAALPELRRLLN